MSLDEYYEQHVSEPEPESGEVTWLSIAIHQDVQHTCQMCHKNVAWHVDTITRHLADEHDTSPAEYSRQFMSGYKFNKEAVTHMLDVTNWADKNTWECRAEGCGLVLPSRVKLVLHIRRSHTLTALEYFRKYKDSLTTDTQHTCQVNIDASCERNIYLLEHLGTAHLF